MLNEEQVLSTRRNERALQELYRISYGLGVNLTTPSTLKESLKIINVFLIITCTVSMYGSWSYVQRYSDDAPGMADCGCVAFQVVISVAKMTYYLFTQHRFRRVLQRATTHDLLRNIAAFREDNVLLRRHLECEVDEVMRPVWRRTRRQLVCYISVSIAISLNYICSALFVNLYHYFRGTPNYEPVLPSKGFYAFWEDKGMTFPYYPVQMFIHGAAIYVSGISAISFDGVFIVLCLHCTGLLRVLKAMVQHSTSAWIAREERVEYLRFCMQHYQRTDAYLQEVQQLYQHIILSQFLFSLFVAGLVLFQASISLTSLAVVIRMGMYLAAVFCQVSIYCYNGQCLTDASEELPLAFYSCTWYEESKEFKQLVRMMLLRSHRVHIFGISWFSTMSVATLMSMIQTSGSYFLLLKNVTE